MAEFDEAPFEVFRQPDKVQELIERLAAQRRQALQDPQTRIQKTLPSEQLSEFEQYGAHIPKEDDEVMAYIEQMLRNQ